MSSVWAVLGCSTGHLAARDTGDGRRNMEGLVGKNLHRNDRCRVMDGASCLNAARYSALP